MKKVKKINGVFAIILAMTLLLTTACSGSGGGSTPAPEEPAAVGTTEVTAENTGADQTLQSSAGETAEETETASEAREEQKEKKQKEEKQKEEKQYKAVVVIDPGHQAHANTEQEPVGPGASEAKAKVSGGTTGVATGVPEYQLALDISLKLRDELEKRGYKVIMTRETNDVDISNSERAGIANEADADAFVRIHANSVGDSGHTGAMTICTTPGNAYNPDNYEKSRALADCILDGYTLETGIYPESVWETDTMTGNNWSQVPVTILEMGYMSNSEEDRKMQDPDMQRKMVKGIANGIDSYFTQNPPKQRGTEDTLTTESLKLSPRMQALKKHLEEEFEAKSGKWSMYLNCLDTGEKFGINAYDPMISASLIKLYIAGCYFDQIEKGVIKDDYKNQLFTMISESNNDSTNKLINVLGMDTINTFMKENGYDAGQLNRRMLEKNGKENYTSAKDCARVLRKVYQGTYVNKKASERIMEAMRAQISRNRKKIPAGIPDGIETANKTGELFTTDENGTSVEIQNDAAIIFVPGNTYILTVMTTVPPVSEATMQREIAELSAEIYEAVNGVESDNEDDSDTLSIEENSAESITAVGSTAETAAESSDKDSTAETAAENSDKDSTAEDAGNS